MKSSFLLLLLSFKSTVFTELFSISRETYKVEFINYKSKSKITFVLDEMYEYIKDEYIKEKSKDIILVKYYLNASNAYVKFKKLNGKFIIEIYNDLY